MTIAEMDWDKYAELMRQLCKASHSAVVRSQSGSQSSEMLGRASDDSGWTPFQALPSTINLFEVASVNGFAHAPAQTTDGTTWLVLVVLLQGLPGHFLLLNIRMQERAQLNELTLRALLCSDLGRQSVSTTLPLDDELAAMLGLASQTMQQAKFDSACLTLCNGLTAEWELLQASIGWVESGQVKAMAVSHLDRFERNSRQSMLIENAYLPALTQGHAVWWASNAQESYAFAALADFAADTGAQSVASVPIQDVQGIVHAVVLLAFRGNEAGRDLTQLQLALELIQPRLEDLRNRSLPLLSRSRIFMQRLSQRMFGPDHSMIKLASVVLLVLLLYATFGTWHYRVEASAQINTEATRVISAQFDGRIDQVFATAGDLVKEGSVLVSLDTRDLDQQRAEVLAEISKLETEVNKHRADGKLAETEIAQARMDQSTAKANRLQAYLQHANGKAPFEGVIVEGERKDLLGAPVKKGDKIFKIAKVEGLYVTLMVAERQMRHIYAGARGEVALLSHTDYNIPIRISSVIPVAQVKGQEGNQFMITAEMLESPQAWWRPGMTGLARIDVGDKNIFWILTHRLVDNLRLLLWW